MNNLNRCVPNHAHETCEVHGRCPKHGDWIRKFPHILKRDQVVEVECPMCEEAPSLKSLHVEMVTLYGDCDRHGRWENHVATFASRRMAGRCPACEKERAQQQDQQERQQMAAGRITNRDRNLATLFDECGIPARFRSRTFENYRAQLPEQAEALRRARLYAHNFDKAMSRGASLIFFGKTGTGKNHLASAIANHVIPNFGVSVLFTTVFSLVQRIRATYGKSADENESDLMAKFAKIDLLIIDEIGVQLGTKHEEVVLTEVINRRYADMKPTILLANLNSDMLAQQLGERVMDRMVEGGGGLIACNWESYRPSVLKDENLPGADFSRPEWLRQDAEQDFSRPGVHAGEDSKQK